MKPGAKTSLVRFSDLEPSWHVPGAKVPGTMRWLISWVGGPAGYINSSPGKAVENEDIGVGFMYLPVGQRQQGLHYHEVTEIYIIIKGFLEGYDGTGKSHRAGPMDLINIPAGVPHGVRNCGSEDVEMVWLHDGVEKKGVTVYCTTEEDIRNAPGKEPITIVSLKDLEPCWSLPRAKEPEFLRWSINWIGGPSGYQNLNRGLAVESEKITAGLTVLMPGNKQPPYAQEQVSETCIIAGGKAVINLGQGNTEVGYLDCLYFPPGLTHSLRNHGTEPAYILWAHSKANPIGATVYQGETNTHCNGNGSSSAD
ncbi:hypothetical protein AYO20_03820 [Fonsecaea nubica]|uniref:Cupin type-2 domain-containing protein n=1 Tax=Fonsecaea nubica TaxID=856822 RepID=A0A178D6N0_9EURO|nr:hypothetical protein AYO20_03820 [Fonsecaea nubica]OAL36765.1 hypothetical protein AYO20_03820 [Fonsecaea nubica]